MKFFAITDIPIFGPPVDDPGFFKLLDIAERFLLDLSKIGDFLINTPSEFYVYNPIGLILEIARNSGSDFGTALDVLIDIFGVNTYFSVPNIFGLSIGELFLSGAMVFYLGFLFIKSFTDIVL